MSKLANQPVSAIPDPQGRLGPSRGMTLRQHYAGLAMQHLASGPDSIGMRPNGPADAAKLAVEYADALIAELEK